MDKKLLKRLGVYFVLFQLAKGLLWILVVYLGFNIGNFFGS